MSTNNSNARNALTNAAIALAFAASAALVTWQIVIGNDPVTENPHVMITGLSPQAVNITARH